MARRRSARHARPTGRGALAAAYTALEVDVARLRVHDLHRPPRADPARRPRRRARRAGDPPHHRARASCAASCTRPAPRPAQPDPYAEMLAAQVTELRATVATQQAMLADLTRRMIDLLEHLEATAAAAASAAAAAAVVAGARAARAVGVPRCDVAPPQRTAGGVAVRAGASRSARHRPCGPPRPGVASGSARRDRRGARRRDGAAAAAHPRVVRSLSAGSPTVHRADTATHGAGAAGWLALPGSPRPRGDRP